ncbi:MAG: sialate O-acetylesterase [Opitutaceae bacterium]
MNSLRLYILTAFTMLLGLSACSAQSEPLDLYLLIGQSNMAGRGEVEAQDLEKPARVWTLNQANEWVAAQDPIHFDKKSAGVGLGRSFGIEMAKQSGSTEIGLIPCAVGGTSIRLWQPGGFDQKTEVYPYDDMLKRLQVALKSGQVKGILWHQGEADGKMGERGKYEPALIELIERVRNECGDPKIPFVVGQLGQFEGRPWSEGRAKVDQAHQAVAERLPYVGFVSSDGLKDKGDLTHFSAEAARTLGERFATKMIELQNQ